MCLSLRTGRHASPSSAPAKARKTEPGLYSISTIVDEFALEDRTVQEYKPGEIVPQSGIFIIKHDHCMPTCRTKLL
jgi:hypothetical protein